jgi:hypothetical protein
MRAPILKVGQQPLAYSINESARMCACKVFHIRRAIRYFELTPLAIGRRSVIEHGELVRWLSTRPRTKSPRKKESSHD